MYGNCTFYIWDSVVANLRTAQTSDSVCTAFLLAMGGGEDASGHVHGSWTQLADRPAAHQEEPGTQSVTLTFVKTNDAYGSTKSTTKL